MTQEKANEIFATELGQQLDVIYVTPDDHMFIRRHEAELHANSLINADPENFVDTTISEWYRTNSMVLDEIRKAFADYVRSEGCGCCENANNHRMATNRLAELLHPKPYNDGSGYDWFAYCSSDF